MSISYGGTPPGITGTHYGGSGLGVLGSLVPSGGLDGAGYLYAGLSLPADAGKEVRGPITRWPSGTLTVYEDSSFGYVGSTDYALYALYVDGVASSDDIGYGAGIGRFELAVGGGELSGNIDFDGSMVSGSLSSVVSTLGGNIDFNDSIVSGSLFGVYSTFISGIHITNVNTDKVVWFSGRNNILLNVTEVIPVDSTPYIMTITQSLAE